VWPRIGKAVLDNHVHLLGTIAMTYWPLVLASLTQSKRGSKGQCLFFFTEMLPKDDGSQFGSWMCVQI
jgi:hypothetical protein